MSEDVRTPEQLRKEFIAAYSAEPTALDLVYFRKHGRRWAGGGGRTVPAPRPVPAGVRDPSEPQDRQPGADATPEAALAIFRGAPAAAVGAGMTPGNPPGAAAADPDLLLAFTDEGDPLSPWPPLPAGRAALDKRKIDVLDSGSSPAGPAGSQPKTEEDPMTTQPNPLPGGAGAAAPPVSPPAPEPASQRQIELANALRNLQGELEPIARNRANDHFKHKYADLAAIVGIVQPLLTKHGFAWSQTVEQLGTGFAMRTVLLHSRGGQLTSVYPVRPKIDDPQGMGSAITYARRYSLSAILGVVTEDDDDGNAGSGRPAAAHPTAAAVPPAAEIPAKSQVTGPAPDGEPTQAQRDEIKRLRTALGLELAAVKRGLGMIPESQIDTGAKAERAIAWLRAHPVPAAAAR